MTNILRFLASLPLMWSAHAVAGPCVAGTLAEYTALGTTGCTIGTTTFASFTLLSQQPTGTVALQGIDIFPALPIGNVVGININVNQGASSPTDPIYEGLVAYIVRDATFNLNGASAYLAGALVFGDAGITTSGTYCAGGTFLGADGVSNCNGLLSALNLIDSPIDNEQSGNASPGFSVNSIAVVTDIAIDPGSDGAAALIGVNNSFTLAAATPTSPVPEPGVLALLAGRIVAAAATRRRTVASRRT